jgi:hypothetical protein
VGVVTNSPRVTPGARADISRNFAGIERQTMPARHFQGKGRRHVDEYGIFLVFILERLFLGFGLLFAALAIIMSVRPARAGLGEGSADVP